MAPRKPTEHKTAGRVGGTVPEAGTEPQSTPERRYADIDPWAVLLEGLMEMPEEGSAISEPAPGGTKDQPEPMGSAKKGRRR